MPTKLLQVSDCHLAREAGADYRGHDPDTNLDQISEPVRRWAPDWLVLTGDLSDDASEQSYARIRDWAARFDCPVAWIPGNHDDRAVMAPIFDAAGFSAGPVIETGGWQLALLDSAWPDDPAGELDEQRLAPLDGLDGERPCGVFVHHQPQPVGAEWIDKVGMRNREIPWRALAANPEIRFVAFGHIHQRHRRQVDGLELLACPSTAANSLPGTGKFEPGETTPLARWFVLEPDGFRSGYLSC